MKRKDYLIVRTIIYAIHALPIVRSFLIIFAIGTFSLAIASTFGFFSFSPIDCFWLVTISGSSAGIAIATIAFYDDFKKMEEKLKNAQFFLLEGSER